MEKQTFTEDVKTLQEFWKNKAAEKAAEWKEYTEYNDHGRLLEDVARFFLMGEKAGYFKAINELHDVMRYMPLHLQSMQERARREMLDEIADTFGEEVRTMVYKCM